MAGRCHVDGGDRVVVTYEGGRLYAEFEGDAKSEVLQISPASVAWKLFEATADFEMSAKGAATALVLHQGGRDVRLTREE